MEPGRREQLDTHPLNVYCMFTSLFYSCNVPRTVAPASVHINASRRFNVGERAALDCITDGSNPASKIKWFRNGVLLTDSDTVQLQTVPRGDGLSVG